MIRDIHIYYEAEMKFAGFNWRLLNTTGGQVLKTI